MTSDSSDDKELKTPPSGENPEWKQLSTRLVYENPWMKLREDKVISPTGHEGVYGVLETPQAAGVLAISDENEAVLVGQARYPVSTYSWEIIEGGVEEGEDPLNAAKRELREEAGIEARSLFPLGAPFHLSNCRTNEVAHLFVATGLTFSEPTRASIVTSLSISTLFPNEIAPGFLRATPFPT